MIHVGLCGCDSGLGIGLLGLIGLCTLFMAIMDQGQVSLFCLGFLGYELEETFE